MKDERMVKYKSPDWIRFPTLEDRNQFDIDWMMPNGVIYQYVEPPMRCVTVKESWVL